MRIVAARVLYLACSLLRGCKDAFLRPKNLGPNAYDAFHSHAGIRVRFIIIPRRLFCLMNRVYRRSCVSWIKYCHPEGTVLYRSSRV